MQSLLYFNLYLDGLAFLLIKLPHPHKPTHRTASQIIKIVFYINAVGKVPSYARHTPADQ
jgi:hypothetical protein